MIQTERKGIDLTDYLSIEREGDVRYEYHEGELFRMAGGSVEHSLICHNTASELKLATRKAGSCISFNSEMKIEISRGEKYVYPDAGLACPTLKKSTALSGAITNPCLIVEVVSESSGDYDRGAKLKMYFSIPGMQEYLLISQGEPSVTIFRRRGDLMKVDHYEGLEAIVSLESIDARLAMADLYENIEFSDAPENK